MQAIERIDISNNWLTITFVVALVLLVLLKSLNKQKLYGYVGAYFQKGFIVNKVKEKTSFFTGFNLVLYVFSILVYAIFLTYLTPLFLPELTVDFNLFVKVLSIGFVYITLFMVLDMVFCNVLEVQNQLTYFVAAKIGYFYSAALIFFPFLIAVMYSFLSIYWLLGIFGILFVLGVVLTFANNKNLIISKLFYFILYLCALEIAPLLIIYKITV